MKLQRVEQITAPVLRDWLASEEDVLVLDVRESGEYARERIDGARLSPLSQFDTQAVAEVCKGKAKVVVYCQTGGRSAKAAEQLVGLGLPVYNLQGGLVAWKQAGLPVVKSANAPISLFRQVQIVAGSLILSGTVLGFTVHPNFHLLSGFVGAGLTFAGITNTCALGMLLAKLPYNQRSGQSWS